MIWSLTEAQRLYPESETWLRREIAPHLYCWEVVCHCGCGMARIESDLRYLWIAIRHAVGSPLYVGCGCRCPTHNQQVYKDLGMPVNPNSCHVTTEKQSDCALDIHYPESMETATFQQICEGAVYSGGLGLYDWGCHVDTNHGLGGWRRW